MAARVTFRVLFGGEEDARKLSIESGIPRTVEDLALKIKTFFEVTEKFRLQYKDKDMDNQFMNLLSTSELEDKGTLKVVYMLCETTRSAPLTEDACCTIPGTPSKASSSSQEPSDSDSHSSNDTIVLSSPETRSCPWPRPFVVPRFSSCAEIMLQKGNDEFKAQGTVLCPTAKVRSDILEGLAEEIIKYTAYPRDEQLEEVAKALIQSHPCLLEKVTRTGYCGWKHYLKIKMMNFRTKLRFVFYLMGPFFVAVLSTKAYALYLCQQRVEQDSKCQSDRLGVLHLRSCATLHQHKCMKDMALRTKLKWSPLCLNCEAIFDRQWKVLKKYHCSSPQPSWTPRGCHQLSEKQAKWPAVSSSQHQEAQEGRCTFLSEHP